MTPSVWWRVAIIVALLFAFAFPASADVAIPQLTGRVVDQTGTLSSGDIAALSQKLQDLETRKGSQVAVLIVPTTDPETIEQFAIRVAEAWKIGRKKIDDGAVLVVAKNDRHLRIEVGYGLEGALTDVTSRRIIDEAITPKFRSGDFAGGITAGVDRMLRVIDGEPLPTPSRSVNFGDWNDVEPLFYFLLFGPLVIGGILRSMFGRLFGSGITGAIVGVLAWFVIGSCGHRTGRRCARRRPDVYCRSVWGGIGHGILASRLVVERLVIRRLEQRVVVERRLQWRRRQLWRRRCFGELVAS